jgi:thiol-disulfide isomerase/thioredoxin
MTKKHIGKRMIAAARAIALALICAFSFAACKADKPATNDAAKDNVASETPAENNNSTAEPDATNPTIDENAPDNTAASPDIPVKTPEDVEWLMNLKAKDIDGKDFDIPANKGKALTIYNVWATWCSPCVEELPELAKIAKDYESKGVRVVGVLIDASDENEKMIPSEIKAAKKIFADAKAEYTSIVPVGETQSILRKTDAVPATFIVGPDGKLIDTVVGSMDYDGWSKAIDKALNK